MDKAALFEYSIVKDNIKDIKSYDPANDRIAKRVDFKKLYLKKYDKFEIEKDPYAEDGVPMEVMRAKLNELIKSIKISGDKSKMPSKEEVEKMV